MSFTPLRTRLAGLPTIIAGPILRRVESDNVTVWFASQQALSNVVLEVSNATGEGLLTSPPSNTITLGKQLHVLALTATHATNRLQSNTTYLYNITFNSSGSSVTLASPGVLATSASEFRASFCYAPFNLPSFKLPSGVADLRIVQGSCRKPHGGETDALRGLDTILELHANDAERPQMLILTGDQIYADDVADALLYMLIDAEDALLQWGSASAPVSETLPGSPTTEQLKPGKRQDTVADDPDDSESGQLSSSEAKSHLISLGEFYCMYLFSWSNVLWPSVTDFPDFNTVYPDTRETVVDSYDIAPLGSESPRYRRVNSPEYQCYLAETLPIKAFRQSLHFVRRALANIPTYMIFDDHEITDDWFLSREWVINSIEADTLSRRIIQNGMAAYAVFQAWGNTPAAFRGGDGLQLLNLLASLETGSSNQTTIFNNIGNILFPSLENNGRELSGSRIAWHYHIEYSDFRLVVLDTRTQRGFPSLTGYPALLSGSAISSQLVNRNGTKAVTLVVSAAPVFGNPKIERIQKIGRHIRGIYFRDLEAWKFNPAAFETFLHHIASYERVVLLSGDVHFSFSLAAKYWNERGIGAPRAAIAQLCGSALKNSDKNTNSIDRRGLILRPSAESIQYLTWASSGAYYYYSTNSDMILESSRTPQRFYVRAHEPVRLRSARSLPSGIPTPQSRYELKYARDQRTASSRPGSITPSGGGSTAQQRAGYRHRSLVEDGHRTVIGRDTISVISFDWPQQKVIQTFWFVPEGLTSTDTNATLLRPFTVHEMELEVPAAGDPRPGD